MKIRLFWMLVLLAVLGVAVSQTLADPLPQSRPVQEVRVQWDAYHASSKALVRLGAQLQSNVFTMLERRAVAGSLPRQRDPQLSQDYLVIIAVDAQGQEVCRSAIPDPRTVRAEFTGPTGELRGEVLHRASTELLILLPDDPSIVEVRVYLPRWTGTEFVLDLLGIVL